jgi:EAL domain-containing protein (putative c-di-GMP-specific phosphodiesterase class I)
VDDVARVLRTTGVMPSAIPLEITETALMVDTARTERVLADLKALGVRRAIDDFGTGYSSLNYLQRMPVDVLKIDRAFVTGIERGGEELALARTITELARTLTLQTVAEGIELPVQAKRLRELGCNYGQGCLYSRPLPPRHILALLSQVDELENAS